MKQIDEKLIEQGEWALSPERKRAWDEYRSVELPRWPPTSFIHSQEFANARHAFRKRINGNND